MRIGFFGGTFDPPHVGHLLVASDALEFLALDRLAFIPNAQQPLKSALPISSAADRLAMVRALLAEDPRFEVDPVELDRGGTSYTVDTMRLMAERHPHDQRFLLLGADVGRTFAHWREPRTIATLAQLAVMRRSDDQGELDDNMLRHALVEVTGDEVPPPVVVRTRRIDVSSTEIRDRVRTGRSIHGYVPDTVARLIRERGLYHTRHA